MSARQLRIDELHLLLDDAIAKRQEYEYEYENLDSEYWSLTGDDEYDLDIANDLAEQMRDLEESISDNFDHEIVILAEITHYEAMTDEEYNEYIGEIEQSKIKNDESDDYIPF